MRGRAVSKGLNGRASQPRKPQTMRAPPGGADDGDIGGAGQANGQQDLRQRVHGAPYPAPREIVRTSAGAAWSGQLREIVRSRTLELRRPGVVFREPISNFDFRATVSS